MEKVVPREGTLHNLGGSGIRDEMKRDIRLPDQISGPPTGWRSAINRVVMLRATIEGHIGVRL